MGLRGLRKKQRQHYKDIKRSKVKQSLKMLDRAVRSLKAPLT